MTGIADHDPSHAPVMLAEVLEAIRPGPGETVVDGTFGAGGYTRGFLATGAEVVAFDRDPSARVFASGLPEDRFALVEARFSKMAEQLPEGCDGVALDLGVSSMQLDRAERGFSFMRDGPLDMRMGSDGPTAADLVNDEDETELARIFWLYGEERQSRRVARALVRRREQEKFTRTLDLAESVEKALGGRRGAPIHPATRVFQALRIAVNEELTELEAGLEAAERALKPGGRLAVVSFHSLEDRVVKAFLGERSGRRVAVSRHRPQAADGPPASFQLQFNGVRTASEAETARNPRARSAKLRAAVRTQAPIWREAA